MLKIHFSTDEPHTYYSLSYYFVYHIKNKISNSIKFSQIKLFLFVIHYKDCELTFEMFSKSLQIQ